MERFTCDWIFKILVVLSDGKVVCGCADPYGERPLGHLGENAICEIWNSERVQEIRKGLNSGYSPFCLPCGLKRRLAAGERITAQPVFQPVLPRIFLEPTVVCNLSCFEAVCSRGSPLLRSRERKYFPVDEFRALIDQVGAGLIRLDFFNYGEPFAHPQAVEMLEYVKARFPSIYLYVSTNGLLLGSDAIARLARAAVDEITFSVDGADQRTYARYRCGGKLARALAVMRDLVRERNRLQREVPFINWRCILFNWNDSDWQMGKIRRLARRIGVDRLVWEITDHPAAGRSEKYQIGTPSWQEIFHEIWDTSQISNALSEKRFRAEIVPQAERVTMTASGGGTLAVRVRNRGGVSWPACTFSGRRHVRLGAQLFGRQRRLLELNYSRSALPHSLAAGAETILELRLPPLPKVGEYWLKLDMSCEGINWFEADASPIVWIPLQVVP